MCLNIYRSSADMLSKQLSPNDQILWNKRGNVDLVVLIDEETSEQDKMNSMKPIWVLRNILITVSKSFDSLYVDFICCKL